ncbi:uncharacterized protein LOC144439952 [Glandiceps talaboti]
MNDFEELHPFEDFKCSICLDELRQPKTLPKCLHEFCRECLSQVILSNRGQLKCPLCRTDNTSCIGDRGIDGLPNRSSWSSDPTCLDNLPGSSDIDYSRQTNSHDVLPYQTFMDDYERQETAQDTDTDSNNLTQEGAITLAHDVNDNVIYTSTSRRQNRGHVGSTEMEYTCPKCERAFNDVSRLNEHVLSCRDSVANFCADDMLKVI